MRARNPLYVMAKPPPGAQAQIAALPRNDPGRGTDLLHVTLLSLFDLHHAPPGWLPAVIAALDSFDGSAFPLAFDRIECRKAVTLRTRAPLPEARAFQAALVRHMLAAQAPMMLGTTPEPHLTINYRGDRLGAHKMPPVGWTVDDILREDALSALGRPKTEIARLLGISRQTLYDILGKKQPVTPAMALRLARMFGGNADSWLNLQRNYDLKVAERELGAALDAIPLLKAV